MKVMKNFPIPKTRNEINSFLGIFGYHRRFIHNFATISQSLTKRLKNDTKINITDNYYIKSFEFCKNLLISEPILAYPDLDKLFELITDASNYAIGCVLEQNEHSITSRTLNQSEKNCSTIEKELLAVLLGCRNFRPHLFRKHLTINRYNDSSV